MDKEKFIYDMTEKLGRAQAVLSCTARAAWARPKAVSVIELGRVIEVACDEIEKAQNIIRELEMFYRKGVE